MFRQVASSADFVNTWETETISSSHDGHRRSDTSSTSTSSERSTCKHSTTSIDTSGQSNSQNGARRSELDRSTRKRPAVSADISPGIPNTAESDEIIGGPPSSKKQCDYVGEEIDQNIEHCRKGKYSVSPSPCIVSLAHTLIRVTIYPHDIFLQLRRVLRTEAIPYVRSMHDWFPVLTSFNCVKLHYIPFIYLAYKMSGILSM